jgi:hypothetical protein
MKTNDRVDVQKQAILMSALVGDAGLASRRGRITAGEIALGTHWIGKCICSELVQITWKTEKT